MVMIIRFVKKHTSFLVYVPLDYWFVMTLLFSRWLTLRQNSRGKQVKILIPFLLSWHILGRTCIAPWRSRRLHIGERKGWARSYAFQMFLSWVSTISIENDCPEDNRLLLSRVKTTSDMIFLVNYIGPLKS